MRIVSFAWTTEALLAGLKTVTRRFWKDSHARRFHKGDLVQAWNKSPWCTRWEGPRPRKVATIHLTADPFKQSLYLITDEDERKEGGLWGSAKAFREMMLAQGKGHVPYVVEFGLVSLEEAA